MLGLLDGPPTVGDMMLSADATCRRDAVHLQGHGAVPKSC